MASFQQLAIHEVASADLNLGALLGSGGFASVCQVKFVRGAKSHPRFADKQKGKLSSTLVSPHPQQFALKRLHDETLTRNAKRIKSAVRGFVTEAKLLASLPFHENIITLHAVSDNFWANPEQGSLILDFLTETLDERLKHWREASKSKKRQLFLVNNINRCKDQRKRISKAALGIATGMEFLHKQGLVFRDLKPDNIGFDECGIVRIFDFGLARKTSEYQGQGRHLTPCSGSLRYMAPEVAAGENYGLPADVYSFAVVLWQICTLEMPFSNVNTRKEMLDVLRIKRNVRPQLRRVASLRIKRLLESSWHVQPSTRPTFREIVFTLRSECIKSRQ